jgi:ATPase subunit of ABC transporter with duplicated ATPase domains
MSNDCNEVSLDKVSDYQSLLLNSGFYEIETTILKIADGLGITALGMDSELGNLSGGQRAKVILAKMLLEKPNIMLLDEPTNFLDREHIDWLSEYLISFEGSYIVISHDFDFLDRITTCVCDIEFGTITKYNGNFSKFIELK